MQVAPGQEIGTAATRVCPLGRLYFAVFLGGPFAGFYLLASNFRAFNNEAAFKRTLFYGVLGTLVYLSLIGAAPADVVERIPSVALQMIYWGFVLTIGQTQKQNIERYLATGNARVSYGHITATVILSLLLFYGCGIFLAFFFRLPG